MSEHSSGRQGRSNGPSDGQRRTYRRGPRSNNQPNQYARANNDSMSTDRGYGGSAYGDGYGQQDHQSGYHGGQRSGINYGNYQLYDNTPYGGQGNCNGHSYGHHDTRNDQSRNNPPGNQQNQPQSGYRRRDTGRDTGRDIGRDTGRDTGRDPGRNTGRNTGRDTGRRRNDRNRDSSNSTVNRVRNQVEGITISPAIETQAASLRHQIESNTYECMVCFDTINAFCATYSCFQCYNIFHLCCTRQWASSKLSEETTEEGAVRNWTCPACQVSSTELPYRYLCYCASVINPEFKTFVLPHSCGEKCTRVRDKCTHACPELCHPGKCPKCVALVLSHCSCRSDSKRVKCNQKETEFKCSKVCGKPLKCGKHFCEIICHSGDCEPCLETNECTCYCGKSNKSIPCGSEKEKTKSEHTGYWSCYERCMQPLMCHNHNCPRTCHADNCDPCDNDTFYTTHCPCGKTKLDKLSDNSRQSCLDAVPTCRKVCRKQLSCGSEEYGNHICKAICHTGSCPPCSDRSLVSCCCQSSSESMLCSDIPEGGLKCEMVCFKKKSCGRHRCNTKCCLEDNHICMIPCGKKLSCKTHKCEELCHRGHCMPCLLSNFREVVCTCGQTKLDPPVSCGTPPPNCNEPCRRQHTCEHPVTHACHYDEYCPPCAYLVNKVCMGGHAVRFNIPCHVMDVSCGETCKKPLPCSVHSCERWCHAGDCVPEGNICEMPCSTKRMTCPHNCNSKCHIGKSCPQTVCFEKVKVYCECKRRSIKLMCFQGATELEDNPDLSRYISKLRASGLSVAQQDLIDYLKNSKLQCVEQCRVEERNQNLAEGLGLTNVPIDAILAPSYSEYLKQEVKSNKDFVIELEEKFAELVAKFKRRNEGTDMLNRVNFVHFDFKPMKKEKRRTVHELGEVYKIGTMSVDDEPQRNVQLKIQYNSAVPSIKLSQFFSKRILGGVGGKPKVTQKPELVTKTEVNLTPLDHTILLNEDIVFDSWEDINEN